jgi:LmbE family N-acetylglucosaminyl deacetylase
MKKVLAIGAHPDDVEFGCSGTLRRHVINGDSVTMLVMTSSNVKDAYTHRITRNAELSLKEAESAANLIGAELVVGHFYDTEVPFDGKSVAFIERIVKERQIDTIYTHWDGDTHQDHANTLAATMAAARLVKNVLCYEQVPLPRITATYPVANYYVDITPHLDIKLSACKCHKSQISKFKEQGFDMLDNLEVLARYRGTQAGVRYAEAFNILKIVI